MPMFPWRRAGSPGGSTITSKWHICCELLRGSEPLNRLSRSANREYSLNPTSKLNASYFTNHLTKIMRNRIRTLTVLSIAVLSFLFGNFTYVEAQNGRTTDGTTPLVTAPAKASTDTTDINNGTLEASPPARPWPASTPTPEADPTLNHEVFEDFLNGSGHTNLEKINQMASAGGGTGQAWLYGPVYEDAWGVIDAHHGTGPGSRLDLVGKTPNMYAVVVGVGTAYEYQVRFNFANLSNATNRYIAFDGFFDGDTVDPEFNRGILFRYSDDINGGRFEIVVREAAGVETLLDTGIAPVVNTWYRLRISVNASGCEALFYINGAVVGTVHTNIAVGPGNRYTAESNNDRLSGTTNFISRRFDYVRFRATSGRGSRL